jgi:quinoprotein glucose dehydrogenase
LRKAGYQARPRAGILTEPKTVVALRMLTLQNLLLSAPLLLSLVSALTPTALGAQADSGKPPTVYQPSIQAASDQAAQAMANFRVPDGFQLSLWAAEPDLANPVAFFIDGLGRIYVAETFRQETEGVPDNRSHRYWLEDDLRLQTVEERGQMYLKHHPEYATEWTDQHDRIRRLVDSDGDGHADQSTVFADGFNDLLDGTGAGVLVRGQDVWYTCIPKLWKLTDSNDDGVADHREVVHQGFGVRVAFRGHDMHGLTIGPDGMLYFSIGDRGYNVVNQEGQVLKNPGRGAVFRCELDGSGLEIFCTGLRNPQELAFDDFGNLFTGDNNCDAGDRARLVYLMEGGDSGWSMNFQYLPDRGPWMSESWWKPPFEGQPAFLNAPILNMTSGPSGITHYPGVGLPDKYRDSFFLVDFLGGANSSGIRRFTLKDEGAGFAVDQQEEFWWGILATDVDFGPDGALYALDWVEGWVGAGKGRIYKLSSPASEDSEAVSQTQKLLAADFSEKSVKALLATLQQPDYRVRLRGQLELMQRGELAIPGLIALAKNRHLDPGAAGMLKPRIHAIWALTRLGAGGILRELLNDPEAEIRAQAAKGIGESGFPASLDLITRLHDPVARVRFFAAQALGKLRQPDTVRPLLELLRRNADQDRFLRHAASYALAQIGNSEALRATSQDPSASVRLGAVLALRQMADPGLGLFLNDQNSWIATEAAIAIYAQNIESALPDLAAALSEHGLRPDGSRLSKAFARRALHAINRLGGAVHFDYLLDFILDSGNELGLRIEAGKLLADWLHPKEFDLMRNQSRRYAARTLAESKPQLADRFRALMEIASTPIQQSVIEAAVAHKLENVDPILLFILVDEEADLKLRLACLEALSQLESAEIAQAFTSAGRSEQAELRARAVNLLATWKPEQALPILAEVLPHAAPPEQAAAFSALASLANESADRLLAEWMERMTEGEVDSSIRLELFEATQNRADAGSAIMQSSLDAWLTSALSNDPLARYQLSLYGGDAATGRKVFFDNPAASCQRCHFIKGQSSAEMPPEVGPELSSVGLNRSRSELLSSILEPAAKISSGFEFYDDQGQLLPISAMTPGLADVLSPRELRDVIAYLDSLRRPVRLMVFTHSAGYVHAVARIGANNTSIVDRTWTEWAKNDPRFEVIINHDPNWFTDENLAQVDSVFFYTTGELPIPESGRAALQAFVENGGGFVGAHCATDTYYDWPWYGKMIGAYFDGHPWSANSTVTVEVLDQNHPATRHFGDGFAITDEIYQMKDPYSVTRLHELLRLNTQKTDMKRKGIRRKDGDFAISWTRRQGQGRVFYSSLGHRPDVWAHPAYQQHLIGGMLWAAGR